MPSEEEIDGLLNREVLENNDYVFFVSYDATQYYFLRNNIRVPQRFLRAMEPGETNRLRASYGLHPEDKICIFLYQKPWQHHLLGVLYKTKEERWKAWLDKIIMKDAIRLMSREEIRKAILEAAEKELEGFYSQEEGMFEKFLEIRDRVFYDINMKLLYADSYKGYFSEPKASKEFEK